MPFSVQPMQPEDVAQVTEIERETFPTLWPPTNYARELKNPLARCIVVCDDQRSVQEVKAPAAPKKGLSLVISWIRELFNHNRPSGTWLPDLNSRYIVGFASLWIMADEAHLTNIAVRESYRRQGIGELLLLSAIDLAKELEAQIITLEVRTSNTTAQALYRKYNFNQVGMRRNYYIDDKEDAILMSTEDINSASFQSQLQHLKEAHRRKLGITP